MTVSPQLLKTPGLIGSASNLLQLTGAVLSLGSATQALYKPNKNPPGISGFLFDIPLADQVKLTAQITDHYVEGNYAIHDHVALEPVRITLTGVLCELVYSKIPYEIFLTQVLDRLTPLGLLANDGASSAVGQSAALARATLAEAVRVRQAFEQTAKVYADLASWTLNGTPAETRQQEGFRVLKQFFDTRQIGTVETPWMPWTNMVIESLTFDQDESSRDLTTVTVQLKQIQQADAVEGIKVEPGKAANSGAKAADKGTNKGKDTSWAKSLLNGAIAP